MMNKTAHTLYILTMVVITVAVTVYLAVTGQSYYSLLLEERFYHPQYKWFNPGGVMGHGLGIIGTLMMLFGVVVYILRKRYNIGSRIIRLKYLLEFHIFLCTLGPILIVFHTSFKFGGLVSVAFWSMVAVVLSGVIGRFIYIQIPRTIEGRELSLNEVQSIQSQLLHKIKSSETIDDRIESLIHDANSYSSVSFLGYLKSRNQLHKINTLLSQYYSKTDRKTMMASIKEQVSLAQRIKRLSSMQKLFKYWHVAHLPFALIMLIIVLVHVVVSLVLGYKWIF
jgi:hypothetical protein